MLFIQKPIAISSFIDDLCTFKKEGDRFWIVLLPQQLLQSLLSFSKISILLPLDQITWVSERVRMVSRLLSSASACCRLLHPARMPREQETE